MNSIYSTMAIMGNIILDMTNLGYDISLINVSLELLYAYMVCIYINIMKTKNVYLP